MSTSDNDVKLDGSQDSDQNSNADLNEHKTWGQVWHEYPKSVFFIVGNEFCERFSYYGMRAVLTLYLINILGYSETTATAYYHGFIVVCYFSPILGCILADGYIGKFHTILWVSLIYASGNIILAAASTQIISSTVHPYLDIFGLLVIGLGTGGIKPCVVAFGGDQFKRGQEHLLEQFFSVFYFSINAGSTISTIITPIFRTQSCLNQDSCYPLAFGVPAMLMVTACLFFIFGSFWYKKSPPKGNILAEVFHVILKAYKNSRTYPTQRDGMLEHYMDDHICDHDSQCVELGACYKQQLVKDIKAIKRLVIMYIPLPFFWALYDQQGSRWIIQGSQMSSKVGSVHLLPDQIPSINPILIMAFIPIFTFIVYPIAGKFVKVTPLRKMTVGGLLAVVAYIVAAMVQMVVNKTLPNIPDSGKVRFDVLNYAPCNITLTAQLGNKVVANSLELSSFEHFPLTVDIDGMQNLTYKVTGKTGCGAPETTFFAMDLSDQKAYYIVINEAAGKFESNTVKSDLSKPTRGEGEFKINFNNFIVGTAGYNISACLGNNVSCSHPKDSDKVCNGTLSDFATNFCTIKPYQSWNIFLIDHDNQYYIDTFDVEDEGAVYTMTLTGELTNGKLTDFNATTFQIVQNNKVNILLQIPQYVVITAAEIMFSITGLEFSYSQAPVSMKSVLQAIWLLSVSLGDLIVIIVAESRIFSNMAYEFFLFAGLMLFVMIIFGFLSQYYYEYVTYDQKEDED